MRASRQMSTFVRRLAALALMLAPLHGSALVWASSAHGHGAGQCRDHVCSCHARRCPPKRPAAKATSGHCSRETPSDLQLVPGSCNHHRVMAQPPASRPHVLPDTASPHAAVILQPLEAPRGLSPHDGFLDIDLPPPRPLS